ncbi:hypothetical protein ACIRVK_36375 [Streptomyces sp. NPDC101152]|uniref:hypothetical protein n=1 Tax=Streptomyces sp. NPDC101152 TaxID=3366116 RepID=UPI003808C86C
MSVPDLLDRMREGKEVLCLSSSAPVAQLVSPSVLRESKADLDWYEAEGRADEWAEPDPNLTWPVSATDADPAGLFTDLPDTEAPTGANREGRA